MYIDRATIHVQSGAGGNGAISFRREKYIPKGGPDGGDGGNGGNVILQATSSELTLINVRYQPEWAAKRGENGGHRGSTGARGADTLIKVPVGTMVFDHESSELLADLDEEGKSYLACKGGRGGKGNLHFVTSVNQAPRCAQPGGPSEEKTLDLELKTVADVGLVGYPNAGKSTLIGSLTNARPKVASYPFTTLHPHVGVAVMPNFRRFTIADIPGLIDGASENVGLGHDFLRHIERCRLLCFVLDMGGVDGRDPITDLKHLRTELTKYDEDLAKRPAILIANKMDMPNAEEHLATLKAMLPKLTIFPTIAELGEDADAIRELMFNTLQKLPPEPPEIRGKILARHRQPQRPDTDVVAEDDDW
ncbi:MAG: GTPase ObgE [Victivallales bacterium]|nr:GTPase ObgE [Victivallales bacterium]